MLTDRIKWIKNTDCIKRIKKFTIFRRINLCLILIMKRTTRNLGYLIHHGVLQSKGNDNSNILRKITLKSGIKRRENWNIIKIVIPNRLNPDLCALLQYLNWQYGKLILKLPLPSSSGGIRYD
ncbi:hypothetical protein DK846_05985 [Methanospirillum lacunae]|uniref:Uncharacterized protein n=1 Tax=Methanospirillum lacunae TaxID=668570 RepID=A0A2V2N7N6_9EURY|nr:hypothetical protein DK846_05985 [Methanospirillum lacunae]